jgi:hypothetical protein
MIMVRGLPAVLLAVLITACNERPVSPLAAAARKGDTARIAELARQGAQLDEPSGVNDWTPLMHAIHTNQAKGVQALLNAGANPNRSCCRGLTPLILAAGYGQAENVHSLLQAGANPMHRGEDGRTALDVAIMGLSHRAGAPMGACHVDAARELLAVEPQLKEAVTLEPVVQALKSCPEIEKLLSRQD